MISSFLRHSNLSTTKNDVHFLLCVLAAYALCEFIFDRVELVSGRLLTCATTCLAHCWNLPVLSRFHFPSTSSISQQQQQQNSSRGRKKPHTLLVLFLPLAAIEEEMDPLHKDPLPLHQQMHSSGLAVCCSRIKRMPLAAQSKSRRFDLALKQLKLCYVCWPFLDCSQQNVCFERDLLHFSAITSIKCVEIWVFFVCIFNAQSSF